MHLQGPGTWNDALAIASYVVGFLVVVVPTWLKWGMPRFRRWRERLEAEHEALAGRPALVDKASGEEVAPPVPSLGKRLAKIDDTLQDLTGVVRELATTTKRVDDHEQRIVALEQSRVERVVSQAESAHMWRAIADQADSGSE